jgi:hypothetical protein
MCGRKRELGQRGETTGKHRINQPQRGIKKDWVPQETRACDSKNPSLSCREERTASNRASLAGAIIGSVMNDRHRPPIPLRDSARSAPNYSCSFMHSFLWPVLVLPLGRSDQVSVISGCLRCVHDLITSSHENRSRSRPSTVRRKYGGGIVHRYMRRVDGPMPCKRLCRRRSTGTN